MIILLVALICGLFLGNIVYYESRVIKGLRKEPKYITGSFIELEMRRAGKYPK